MAGGERSDMEQGVFGRLALRGYGHVSRASCRGVASVLEGFGLVNIMCMVGEDGEEEEECFVPMMQCYEPSVFKDSLAEIMSTPEAADLMRSRAHVRARRHGGMYDEIRTGIGTAEHAGSIARDGHERCATAYAAATAGGGGGGGSAAG